MSSPNPSQRANAVTNAVSSLSTLSVCLAVYSKKMVTRFCLKSFCEGKTIREGSIHNGKSGV